MKRAALLLALSAVLVFALSGVAMGVDTSGYHNPSGSPHGNYTTTTKNCGVCHAVHKAVPTGELLMRDTVANACVYCHITSNTGLIQIYNADADNYNVGDLKNAHSVAGGAECTDCHTPHGAKALILDHTYLEQKILKGMSLETTSGAAVTVNAGDSNDVAVSKWCTNCHNSVSSVQGTPYYETRYDNGATMGSHVMKASAVNYADVPPATYNLQVAWSGSETCRSCHADGTTNTTVSSGHTAHVVASSYPHFTAGQRFLTMANDASNTAAAVSATDSELDLVCIRCHVESGGTAGAGITY
ncbi:MAG: hypothetical protein ABFC80_06985 [Coriobacteriales bacterium]